MKGCIMLFLIPFIVFLTLYSIDSGCFICLENPDLREKYQSQVNVFSAIVAFILMLFGTYAVFRKPSDIE